MTAIRVFILAVAAAALLAPGPATTKTYVLSTRDRADVARVNEYLNAITTVKARFRQIAPSGALAAGTIYISRPGKMRVEYDPPVKVLIVATGIWLIYFDGELGQTSYLPLGSSPASFLIKGNTKLGDDITVTKIVRRKGELRVDMTETGSEEKGSLRMIFDDKPLRLKAWTVVDAQGKSTQVRLIDAQFGLKLDTSLFEFVSPDTEEEDPQ